MGELITGYFNSSPDLPRLAYLSKAKISLALESLEYFFAEYGEGIRRPESKVMLEGRKLHQAVLEPDVWRSNRFPHRFSDMRNAEAQAWQRRILAEHPNANVMTYQESLTYDRIIDRVMSHRTAGPLIKNAVKERHGIVRCPETGFVLYSRPDILTPEGEMGELKFVKSVDEFEFNRQQYSEQWFMQLAFYNFCHGIITGKPLTGNCFYIAVEPFYPHRMLVTEMAPKFEEMGNILWREGRDKILACLEADPLMKNYEIWRACSNEVRVCEPEIWMLTKDPRFASLIGFGT